MEESKLEDARKRKCMALVREQSGQVFFFFFFFLDIVNSRAPRKTAKMHVANVVGHEGSSMPMKALVRLC